MYELTSGFTVISNADDETGASLQEVDSEGDASGRSRAPTDSPSDMNAS